MMKNLFLSLALALTSLTAAATDFIALDLYYANGDYRGTWYVDAAEGYPAVGDTLYSKTSKYTVTEVKQCMQTTNAYELPYLCDKGVVLSGPEPRDID